MKLHRFIGKYDLSGNEISITDPGIIKQIKTVLRLGIGGKFILSDGKNIEAEVKITSLAVGKIICEIEKIMEENKDVKKVNLYLAMLKKENFELAAQKATETGVYGITPIVTERTIKTGLNQKRLEKIMLEASEQCGRNKVPILHPILKFKEALENGVNAEEKIIFHLATDLYAPDKTAKNANIFVGPEGGFTEKEIKLAKTYGYTPASLGELTLRGETAAIISTYRAVNNF